MTVSEVYNALNALYPFDLSNRFVSDYGGYDNSGVILNTGALVNKVVWSLDLSEAALTFAKEKGAQLIITHHPAIYRPIHKIDITDCAGKNLIDAIKNGISVISMHLNLDVAENGIDAHLANLFNPTSIKVLQPLDSSGYGRLLKFKEIDVKDIEQILKDSLKTDKIRVYPNAQARVSCAAVFAGAGVSDAAPDLGAELICGSEIKHHIIAKTIENGGFVIDIPHYAAENYSFKKIYQVAAKTLLADNYYFCDKRLL